jgi:hypothetical protein
MAAIQAIKNGKKTDWRENTAIVVSIASLGIATLNFLNQQYQNKKVEVLRQPKVVVDEVYFENYATISQEFFDTANWGYSPYAYQMPDNRLQVPYFLKVKDSTGKFFKTSFGFTKSQVKKHLAQIGYKGRFEIYKCYTPQICLKNIGPNDAIDLSSEIYVKSGGNFNLGPWTRMDSTSFGTNSIISNQKVYPRLDITIPANLPLSDTLYFKIHWSYSDEKKHAYEGRFNCAWYKIDNRWSLFGDRKKTK